MRKLVYFLIASLEGVVLADISAPPSPMPITQSQNVNWHKRRRLTPEQQMERFGGFLMRDYSGKYCYFFDTQSRVGSQSFDWISQQVALVLSLPLRYEKSMIGNHDIIGQNQAMLAEENKVGAFITVVDIPDYPSILIAPENGWAQVNVAALAKDNPSAEVLDRRVKKELWRAFVMLFGGGNSSMLAQDLMRPVNSLADLDAKPNLAPGPEPFNAVLEGARARGITPVYRTTYRQACIEGWAPAPTNDFQRAILEKIRSEKERGPTKAIQITP